MITIYGIKNCSTMKKAFDLLNELDIPYAFHDYKKLGIDATHLQQWADHVGLAVLLNKKGTTWRKLSPEQQTTALQSDTATIQTLVDNTSMIKRPVLVSNDKVVVGFDADAYRALGA